jgi:hypothetical protein
MVLEAKCLGNHQNNRHTIAKIIARGKIITGFGIYSILELLLISHS